MDTFYMFHMFIDLLCKSYQGTRKIMKTKKNKKNMCASCH